MSASLPVCHSRSAILGAVVALCGIACDKPPPMEMPPGWQPVPLAKLAVPADTPCAEGLEYLYAANCTGQEEQTICLLFVVSIDVFSVPGEGLHCHPKDLDAAQHLALRFTQRSEQRAPPELRDHADVRHRVDDQRLWLIDGFIQGLVENAKARPGKEVEAEAFRKAYKPTDFKTPVPRPPGPAPAPTTPATPTQPPPSESPAAPSVAR